MSDTLLTIRDLRIEGRQGDIWQPIIKCVDLDLRRGEVLGLIGESGAGKSTLGLAAMGYSRDGTRISQGSVTFDGMDLLGMSERRRRGLRGKRIAYVAQSAAAYFNPAHRLIDQYAEAPTSIHRLIPRGQAEQEAREIYAQLRLPNPDEIGFRYPHQVSGGQLQRAMTAMAMSCKPDLIIFDEPTTALDVTTQIEVLGAIRDVVRELGTAAIYITHDLAVVAQMADRIKILLRGEEVEEQPTRDMLAAPKEEYSRSLWAVRSFTSEEKSAPASDEVPVIRVRNVTAEYVRGAPVLDDVSFDIHAGHTVAVVGESGSGKSTTARAITGLLPPVAGAIELDGAALPAQLAARSKDELRQVQMIYQSADTALNPKQTIREIIGRPIRFYLGLRGKAQEEKIRELLSAIELEPDQFIDRYPAALSGGQKQRIGIARALAAEPRFIICDEVTSALDQLVAEGILRLLKRLQEERGLAYMFITHDLATVKAIADYVVVMQKGRVVEQGPKGQMFSPPHHPYTKLLLSSVPEMDPDWLDTTIQDRKKG
ncbi:ABC transporter ATP-binding protein [Thalassovita aquimarina]|uniref:ABC transporter ATP-binding protein n=1 Tax=Thalassovita aquimarina TaxID=2785917 RepID=A0ABS5HWE4_9RHOB|nr:ABC transporter ATP-binding protein [Thalassovita aquimarina]MBR9653288.1 ABC transporter ATP-binding protein [Thalassovita aquimarina]